MLTFPKVSKHFKILQFSNIHGICPGKKKLCASVRHDGTLLIIICFRSSDDYHGCMLHFDLSSSENNTSEFGRVWRCGLSHQEAREKLFQDAYHNFFEVYI